MLQKLLHAMNSFTRGENPDPLENLELCPLPGTLVPLSSGKVLLVAPHADDETIGCGGALALLSAAGCAVHLCVITDGAQGDPHRFVAGRVVEHRREETRQAMQVLGIQQVTFMDEPDGAFQDSQAFQQRMADYIGTLAPDWLLLPSPLDYHRDHVRVAAALLALWIRKHWPLRCFLYELWSPLPINRLIDITQVMALKERALECYQLPARYFNYRDVALGLAIYRGCYLGDTRQRRYAEGLFELRLDNAATVLETLLTLRLWVEEGAAADPTVPGRKFRQGLGRLRSRIQS